MKIFDIKDFKKLFILTITVLLAYILLGQVVISTITSDYKSELIKHDYEIAGCLYRNGGNAAHIETAFTKEKSAEDYKSGKILLESVGYDENINTKLIPNIEITNNKYKILVFILFLFIGTLLLFVLFMLTTKFDKTLENASLDIMNFMNGDHKIRLDDDKEGNLSKLFSAINIMATSQTSLISKEKQSKEFLKDTISDISHQLKTPLAALEMYNEIILDENIDNEVVRKFNLKIKRELERMENLIQNLLKLAKFDACAIKLNKQKYNLKVLLEDILMGFETRAQCERKRISLN